MAINNQINRPNFFSKQDFVNLNTFVKQKKDKDNKEHTRVYNELVEAYKKTEYWAKVVQEKCFPNGYIKVVKKPTNQASKFEYYLWAKIYPTYSNWPELAFVVGINNDYTFDIKIDTVGLQDNDELRKKYFQYRDDISKKDIVLSFKANEILGNDWDNLIILTNEKFMDLIPSYKELAHLLGFGFGNPTINKTTLTNSLNTILYGPPGTGKTYNTINKALDIIGFDTANKSRQEIKDAFDKNVNEGQIVFTTFHQSMSYEDFIEGIKPLPVEKGQVLKYDIVDGIFKTICTNASKNDKLQIVIGENKNELTKEIFEDLYYNFSALLPQHTEDKSKVILKTIENNEFELFQNSMGSICVKAGLKRTNMSVSCNELLFVLFNEKLPVYKSYEQIIINKILEDKSFTKEKISNTSKKFVIIIDEINRGNVSQIFGELITLIEDDKRIGCKEHLLITLPYSKSQFGVPNNLYIIGTMNTADRSVEALDTALRRRFVFEEMMPIPEFLAPERMIWQLWWDYAKVDWDEEPYKTKADGLYKLLGIESDFDTNEELWQRMKKEGKNENQIAYFDRVEFTGIDLQELLETINKRIEVLLSRDNLIGHSYFISVTSEAELKTAFQNKIIPLLQEYFFGDYGKIGLVLGSEFVEIMENETAEDLFADFEYDGMENLAEKTVYKLVDINNFNDEEFMNIVNSIF
jgi:5-methylcytosine-specific restriction enzyme B